MRHPIMWPFLLAATLLTACSTVPPSRTPASGPIATSTAVATAVSPAAPIDPLFAEVAALDGALFDSFNRCRDPEQLRIHAAMFAADVEFYHDKGGLLLGRDAVVDATRRNVCHSITRELVPGTLRVFPIPGYGAMEQGTHRFCPQGGTRCEGAGDFLILWHRDGDAWRVSRVFSYDHHAL